MKKHAVTIRGHRTSISLEAEFWAELKSLAARQSRPLASLIAEIDATRAGKSGLSSALRLYVLSQIKK
ncbi:MAG TPA: aryl-sulfate sulfotransferase [Rhodospirillaceae bacterium]|nr:aryl-sulfate sulfotransferase [Rhodospirillaceae bacterium]